MCLVSVLESSTPILLAERFSDFAKLKHITAWVSRFISICCHAAQRSNSTPYLTDAEELTMAENYWFSVVQKLGKLERVRCVKQELFVVSLSLPWSKWTTSFWWSSSLNENIIHPVVLRGKHLVTKLIVCAEHLRLLHARSNLTYICIVPLIPHPGMSEMVRSITRGCITCKRQSLKSIPPWWASCQLSISPQDLFLIKSA